MSEVENVAPVEGGEAPSYTPEEQVYIDTRGGEVETGAVSDRETPSEAKATPDVDASGVGDKGAEESKERKLVDKGALDEERARRKALQEEVNQYKIERARWEERFRMVAPQPGPPKPPPTADEDIFGAVKHQDRVINHIAQKIGTYEQQLAAENQLKQLGNWAAGQESEFKKETPDYDDALKHLRQSRVNELKSVWGLNDAQINNQLIIEERQILMAAARIGKNPAELAYNSAKERGYKKTAAKTETSIEDLSKKLDTIEEGQKAARSLSGVGGRSGGGELSIEQVYKMPDDEFEAWKTKNYAKWRRMKGAEY